MQKNNEQNAKVDLIDFEGQIHYWANRISFLLRKELHARLLAEGMDIRGEEFAILMQLWRQPGQTPSMLADKTIRDRTTVTRLLDGMVKKALVVREVDPEDRRRVIVNPTKQSISLQAKIMPIVQGLIASTMEGITEADAETARLVLSKLTENLLELRNH